MYFITRKANLFVIHKTSLSWIHHTTENSLMYLSVRGHPPHYTLLNAVPQTCPIGLLSVCEQTLILLLDMLALLLTVNSTINWNTNRNCLEFYGAEIRSTYLHVISMATAKVTQAWTALFVRSHYKRLAKHGSTQTSATTCGCMRKDCSSGDDD